MVEIVINRINLNLYVPARRLGFAIQNFTKMSINIPFPGEKEIVKQASSLGKRNICIPVDGSVYSEQTVAWAEANVLQKTDLIVLLNVKQPIPVNSTLSMGDAFHQESRDLLLKYGMRD